MKFTVHATAPGSRARVATLETARTTVETPVFMPVGTRGTVRTQPLAQLTQLDAPILLANTYHLMIRPGIEAFTQFGGLHRWMGWPRSILTDSGGFQIFSLPETTIDDTGATLRGHGTRAELLTPERSIAMQCAIGSDIMMVLDQCIASTSPRAHAVVAMDRTHRWAARSLAARGDSPNALFAIVQGACFPDLRRISAAALTELGATAPRPFDGYAIGGLAVGETRAEREDTTELVTAALPTDRPRYLMGVGMPIDLLEAVHRGVDMFDCILPTALAQQGVAFTSRGRVDLRRGVYRLSDAPLDAACRCEACARPRSYLHHLFKCKEPLGWQLLAFHNLSFYTRLMADIRAHIRAGTFTTFLAAQREILDRTDLDNPPGPSPRIKSSKPAQRGAFVLHTSPRGFSSIQHVASGEIMHSVNEPDVEAARIYVAQSVHISRALAPHSTESNTPGSVPATGSAQRITTGSVIAAQSVDFAGPTAATAATSDAPLVVWDVGLGAGHNAMALVRAIDAAAARGAAHRPIALISFEHDLDAFRLALAHGAEFPHLRHRAPHILAHRGHFHEPRFTWTLREADFLTAFPAAPRPDVIFYDPFSSKVDTVMWSADAFARLFTHLTASPAAPATPPSPSAPFGGPVELFTYTNSTAIRSAMLAAGFHVARGVGSGPKPETTIALTQPLAPHALLGRDWLDRRDRSTAKIPADVPPAHHAAFEHAVLTHVQFA